MGHAEARAQHAQRGQVRHQAAPVLLLALHRLGAALGQMGLHRQAEVVRQLRTVLQEVVAAVQRDGGRQAQAHAAGVERPVGGRLAHHVQLRLRGGRLRRRHGGLQVGRQALSPGGVGLPQRAVGQHRRHHGAQAHPVVGAGHGQQAGQGGLGEFTAHVEGGGAAALQQFHRVERGAQRQIVQPALAVDGGRRGEKAFQRHIGHRAPPQRAVGVGVAVDQAGHHQPIPGVDHPGSRHGSKRAGRAHGPDAAVLQQQVAGLGGLGGVGQQQAVGNDAGTGHGCTVVANSRSSA